MATYPPRKQPSLAESFVRFGVVLVIIAAGICYYEYGKRSMIADIRKQESSALAFMQYQDTLDKYHQRFGAYPRTLAEEAYLRFCQEQGFTPPVNPYTRKPVRAIAFKAEPSAGELTYLHLPAGDYPGGKVDYDSYYLIQYGPTKYPGEDVDDDGTPDHVAKAESGAPDLVDAQGARHKRRPPVILARALQLLKQRRLLPEH